MKRAFLCLSILVMVGLILPQDVGGNPPPPDEGAFTYLGELHRLGESYSGTADFRFTLWDAPTDGAQVAPMQARSKLTVSDGLFQARLRFDETTFDDAARWLEIEVRTPSGEGRFTTLAPRQQIVSSRHDLRDVNADEAGDEGGDDSIVWDESDEAGSDVRASDGASSLRHDESSSALRDGSAVGQDGIPTMLRRADTLGDDGIRIASDSPWRPDSNGIHYKVANVGIGTNSASSSRLSVRGDRAIFGRSDSRRGRGVFGLANKTTGPNFGVYGQSKSNRGRGVFGIATATTGTTFGVHGKSFSTSGRGVFGEAIAATGFTFGGRFESDSTNGSGVFGTATATTGGTVGVFGQSNSTSGIGVFGFAGAGSGINWAVRGLCASTSGFDFFAAGAGMDYGTNSSRRWKHNIENIDYPLEKIARLRGVYFDWDSEHGGHHDVGMIAEEVGEVLPEIVNYEENGIDAIGMDYSKMTPLLVEAVNALRKENAELRDRLAGLEAVVARLASEQKGSAR